MANNQKQVFLTDSPTRWQRFKWTSRIIITLLVLMPVVVFLAAGKYLFVPDIPKLKGESSTYKSLMAGGKNAVDKELSKKFDGFGKFIVNRAAQLKHIRYVSRSDSSKHASLPVRAAFYDANDEQSYFSLKNNVSKINMLLPTWMSIDSLTDTVVEHADMRGVEIIRGSGVPVVAMLSNFWGDDFNGKILHELLNNPAKRKTLINQVVRVLTREKFAGVNVDFEELQEGSDEVMVQFMKEMYAALHPLHLLVTQDVSPFNPDYNLKALSAYCDYVFLMAYDEHYSGGKPGPISSQNWIEAATADALKQVPAEKLVLGMAGYGYDWPKDHQAADVTFAEALSIARESGGQVSFDTASYNLQFGYADDDGLHHDVWFTDAATNFNTMRFAAGSNVAGVALWRMGSEDGRLWTFYNRSLDDDGVDGFDYSVLKTVNVSNDVDYIGEGEILDVVTTPRPGAIDVEVDTAEDLIAHERYDSLPSIFVIRKYGHQTKKVVLSFDDGPDAHYTPAIIDILSREHVPAVFFLIGINAENNIPIVKRLYREGFEVGNHTFTHPNMALVGPQRALMELNSTRLLIESITGHSTILFRAPYNADSEPETMMELEPVALSKANKYLTVGESIDPNDWEVGVNADTIFARVVQQEKLGNIILLHDAGGPREETIKALPRIIHYFKDKGYTFTTISDLLGETREQLMPPVPKTQSYYAIQTSYFIAEFGFWCGQGLFYLFAACIVLSVGRILFLAVPAALEYRDEKRAKPRPPAGNPLVSIIVPAYNEEVNAVTSLNNLLKSTYTNFNIVFVDDGSKDATYAKVRTAFEGHPKVQVLTKPNGGKASALNFGIGQTDAEYVMCIDADTNLAPDALAWMVRHMGDPAVGAVAGNVKVGNEVNMLTRWQSIEYITSQNFDRNAFARLNAITVVPGAIGLFRKKAIADAGGFTSDTFAEDCDLTMRMLRAGYVIRNENRAIALTEAPETLGQFLKQRFRWSFGIMQSFWKNRDALLAKGYGALGYVALPNLLLFQIFIPLIAPLADFMMVVGIITGNALLIFKYYGLYMLIDLAVAVMAFSFERENMLKLVWLIPQRIIYRWLMLYILYKSIRRALRGQLQSWGVLKRTGNVKENPRLKSFKI
jgi:peptidoglycan-N-acetylglucosamine deacetylase